MVQNLRGPGIVKTVTAVAKAQGQSVISRQHSKRQWIMGSVATFQRRDLEAPKALLVNLDRVVLINKQRLEQIATNWNISKAADIAQPEMAVCILLGLHRLEITQPRRQGH